MKLFREWLIERELDDNEWAKIHGVKAAKRGKPKSDNPYPSGTRQHALWHKNWARHKVKLQD